MKTITVQELKKRLEKNDVLLVDVREVEEHQNQRIEDSILIPLQEILLERLPENPKPIVIYCRSGKRSADACLKLLSQDPDLDVYSLDGGIIAWHQAGFNTI